MSDLILPPVSFTPPFTKLPADPDALPSLSSETCGGELRTLSVFGSGIAFSSKSFSDGTGPLFAFTRRNADQTETLRWAVDLTLSQSVMQNMTSRTPNISSPLVRSVSQRLVSTSVTNSTNHLYGTACLNMNAGSSILCSNSSFTSCTDTTTSYEHFSVATNIKEITGKATFRYCTMKGIDGHYRGAINQETASTASATLDISWCSFQSCSIPGNGWNGVISQLGSASNVILMTHSILKNNYVEHGGGVCINQSASQSISQCIFSDCSTSIHGAAVFSNQWDASATNTRFSNILFQNCAQLHPQSSYGSGAVLFNRPKSMNLQSLQFRNCSSVTGKGNDFQVDGLSSIDRLTMLQLDSTSTGTHVFYSNMSPLPSPHQLPTPSSSFSLTSVSAKATAQWTVQLTMMVNKAITGTLLVLADNSASDRTEPSGYAPNIARFLPFVFSGSTEGTCSIAIGETSFLQLHLDQYLVTAASLTGYAVTVPDGFSLPTLPTLVSASCSLDEFEQNVVITLELRTESIGMHTVTLNTSPVITFEVEFKTGKNGVSEPTLLSITGENKKLSPDTTYEIQSVTRQSDGLIVLFHPVPIKFTVPKRSCLTTLSETPVYTNLDKLMTISLSGSKLVGTHIISFSVNGSVDAVFVRSVVFGSDGKGSLSGVLFDTDSSQIELHYNTRYDVIGVTKNGFDVDFEVGLGFVTMMEPMRLLRVGEPVDKDDRNVTTISLTGHAAVSGSYTLIVENTKDSTEKVSIDASFTAADAGKAQAILYPTRELKYGETYKVTGMVGKMSSPPTIHVEAGLMITLDSEPSRLTFIGPAAPQDKEKGVSMALTGIKMTNGPFIISLNGSKRIKATFTADGVTGSSTAILFSSTASEVEVELDYGQTYTVVGVTDKDDNEVFFHASLSFTTPPEPTRLVSFSIVEYDSLKKNVLVTMDGRQLDISSKYEVDVSRTLLKEHTILMEWNVTSLRWEGSASLFPTMDADLVFGETYSIVEFRKESISTPLFFEPNSIDIMHEPSRLTAISPTPNYTNLDKELTFTLDGILLSGDYTLTLSVNTSSSSNTNNKIDIDVSFTSSSASVSRVLFNADALKVNFDYDTHYEVDGLKQGADSVLIEPGLGFTTMKEPMRLMEVGEPVDKDDRNSTTILLTGHAALEGSYELDLENSEDSTEKVRISATFTSAESGEAQARLYPTRELKYGETYKVTGMVGKMSSPPKIHVEAGLTIKIDPEPPRLTFMGPASPQDKEKEVSMALSGIKMTNGPFIFSLNGSKTIPATYAADGVTGSSTAILFSTTASEIEVEYGQTYSVVGVTDKDNQPVLFHASLSFTTPPEPTRLVSFSIVEYDSLKKNVLVTMDGTQLDISSKYEVDVSRTLLKEHTILMEWNVTSLRWEGSASLFPTMDADLVFGETYSIVEFRKESISTPLFFEPNTIRFIPEPPRLISISSADNDIQTLISLTLNTTQLVAGTVYQVTFAETPRSSSNSEPTAAFSIDVTASDTGVITTQLELYPTSTAVLKYGHSYNVLSMTAKTESTPILIETPDCVFDTPFEPTRVESGSATLNSQRDTASIVMAGRELKVGTYSIVLESGAESFSTTVTTTTEGELSFTAPTTSSSDPSKVLFGLVYSFKTVKLNGSDVFVNLDASVEIPVPPKMSGVSVTPNTIGTGLLIRVTGSDLPVGETYNLTVVSGDSSFSYPITFSDSTTGSSEMQRVGWTDSLQFSTTYAVTSFSKVGDENDQIVVLSTFSFDTPTKPVNLIVYSESKSTDRSALCGEITRPCSSVDDAWRVVLGIRFRRVGVEIVDGSSLSSPMCVEGGMVVTVKNGDIQEPSLKVGDFTPTTAQPGLITVIDSSLELKDVDVVFSSTSPLFVFIHSKSSTLTMKEGSFTNRAEGSAVEGGLCGWETGVIQVFNTETIVKSTVFSHLHQGAINMKGGNLTVEATTFHNNTQKSSSFPSLSHNIHCSEEGEIEIGSLSGGDGSSETHPHLWLSHDECILSGADVNVASPFFIPTLNTSSSKTTFDKKSSTHTFDLIGSTFLPCGLFLEVFEKSGPNGRNGEYTRELTESSTLSFTETAITLAIPQKEIAASIAVEAEWHARLVFGDGSRTESFRVKLSGSDERKALTKQAMKWVVPVICASVALLLFIIILAVLLRRRSQKKKNENSLLHKKEEMDSLPPEKIEDFDNLAFPPSSIVSLTDTNGAFGVNHADPSETKLIDPPLLGGGQFEMNVEGVRADVGVAVVKIDRRDTLYNRLHMNGKKVMDKKTLAQALAHSLARLSEMNAEVTLLGRLSSHFVLFGPNDEIHLDLKEARDVNEIDVVNGQRMVPATVALNRGKIDEAEDNTFQLTQPTTQPSQQGEGFELLRWRAPEAAAKSCEPAQTIDYAKAAVFSLGLILFEIETETMPFGDMDAMNAFRQLKSGVLPRVEVVKDENLRELIVSCLNLDASLRPNLDGIEKQLESTEFTSHSDWMVGMMC
ncbi:hypothetical protein BLNAU_20521 [Blattamonas nauphoetae]|uniref:Protein kinase domain-containing protein n=1 Tax=Blattamonas nauphoetae TaxID=2049346 RepID=A0ABQ9WYI4_9EUKA|nr:hypothetical protein BLNAU_20521 [Blattamonas nauphoetae]